MNRQQALDEISTALAVLIAKVRTENLSGYFSLNRLAEDIFLPVFRLVYNSKGLRNANAEQANYPYIDLVDDKSRLAIQISATRTESKITATLTKFLAIGNQKKYRRLVFFILSDQNVRFAAKTKKKWKRLCGKRLQFDPTPDIVSLPRLLPLIGELNHSKLIAIRDIIACSVIGQRFIDVDWILRTQSQRQLEYEKETGKYIPDVFIETRDTKNIARCFSHPTLFLGRTLAALNRLPIKFWNRFLKNAGLPPLAFPDLQAYRSVSFLVDAVGAAAKLDAELESLSVSLEKYSKITRGDSAPFPAKANRKHVREENYFLLQNALGWGLNHQLKNLREELRAIGARVLILTGKAGQGKTNLVCDFVENFLLKHDIPCAYLSGRSVSIANIPSLEDAIQKLVFDGRTANFSEAATLLSAFADRANKPFVLIIDALNEHHRIREFADQMGEFIRTVLRYPNLKLFLTCRSEFFHVRFGNLVTAPLSKHTILLESNERRMEPDEYTEMVDTYFGFFEVRADRVSERVVEKLKKDILLLRFFCEAYGAKGKPSSFRQKEIRHIYREDIFKTYLESKLGTADLFLQRMSGQVPLNPCAELHEVLGLCVGHMLQSWTFGNVPVSIIPPNLDRALFTLLDEELILRRDAPADTPMFSPSQETINVTFDELRDYLLAQFLLHRVFATDLQQFEAYLAKSTPQEQQIVEGIKRFLFYASRHPSNQSFWEYYQHLNWYKDVYDSELFNIDEALLKNEDKDIVVAALLGGGKRAQNFARSLAVRWRPVDSPLLNLDLFLSVVSTSDNDAFDLLVIQTFTPIRNINDGSSVEAFCKFVETRILPDFKPRHLSRVGGLFRFLALLLPVGRSPDLNSAATATFRKILEKFPQVGISILKDSLALTPTRHRAQVWRLLATVANHIKKNDPLLALAGTEGSHEAPTNEVSAREANWFLDHWREANKVRSS